MGRIHMRFPPIWVQIGAVQRPASAEQAQPDCFNPANGLEHDPEKWPRFSEKIMLKS
jgi:hypothetical protein